MNPHPYQYRLNRFHREDLQRAVRRHQLMHLAWTRRPKTARAYSVALLVLWQSLFR